MVTTDDFKLPSKIADNLYLSGAYNAANIDKTPELGISVILDVSGEMNYPQFEGIEYHCIPFPDGREVSETDLVKCYNIIQEAHAKNQIILVHCAAGVSRSASVVAMYILNRWIDKKYIATLDQALDHIRLTRNFINPAPAILVSVKKYLKIFPYDGSYDEER